MGLCHVVLFQELIQVILKELVAIVGHSNDIEWDSEKESLPFYFV